MSSTYSLEISRAEFLKMAAKVVGDYKYEGEKSKFCHSGHLLFVNSNKPEEGLRLSNNIFFGPFVEEASHLKEDGYCSISEDYHYSKNFIKQITKVHKCEKEHRTDESVSTQTLTFKGNKIIYKSLESGLQCTFVRVKERGEK